MPQSVEGRHINNNVMENTWVWTEDTLKTMEDIFTSGLPAWHCQCSAGGSAHLPGWKTERHLGMLASYDLHIFTNLAYLRSNKSWFLKTTTKTENDVEKEIIISGLGECCLEERPDVRRPPFFSLSCHITWASETLYQLTTIFHSLLSHHVGVWNTVSTDHHFSLPPVPVLAWALSQHTDTSKNAKATLNVVMCCTATCVTTFTHGKLHAQQNPLSTMDINWAEDSVTWQ